MPSSKESTAAALQPKEPPYSRFTQQELPCCRPLLTPKKVIAMFLIIGVVFIPIGAVCLAASRSVVEVSQRYDNDAGCIDGSTNSERKSALLSIEDGAGQDCSVKVTIPEDMEAPVYVYYKLTNFYQNHRRYVKSRADAQLRGDDKELSDDVKADCEPQLYKSGTDQEIISPCGLMAWSYFNDTYEMYIGEDKQEIREKGIAWKTDKKFKFSNLTTENFQDDAGSRGGGAIKGPLKEDEHFIVWMRTAALPTFRKLWGVYEGPTLEKGTEVSLNIKNRYNTYAFDGSKTIILSTTSWMGGKNDFLGIAYLAIGGLCFGSGLICTLIHMVKPRILGDSMLLSWNK